MSRSRSVSTPRLPRIDESQQFVPLEPLPRRPASCSRQQTSSRGSTSPCRSSRRQQARGKDGPTQTPAQPKTATAALLTFFMKLGGLKKAKFMDAHEVDKKQLSALQDTRVFSGKVQQPKKETPDPTKTADFTARASPAPAAPSWSKHMPPAPTMPSGAAREAQGSSNPPMAKRLSGEHGYPAAGLPELESSPAVCSGLREAYTWYYQQSDLYGLVANSSRRHSTDSTGSHQQVSTPVQASSAGYIVLPLESAVKLAAGLPSDSNTSSLPTSQGAASAGAQNSVSSQHGVTKGINVCSEPARPSRRSRVFSRPAVNVVPDSLVTNDLAALVADISDELDATKHAAGKYRHRLKLIESLLDNMADTQCTNVTTSMSLAYGPGGEPAAASASPMDAFTARLVKERDALSADLAPLEDRQEVLRYALGEWSRVLGLVAGLCREGSQNSQALQQQLFSQAVTNIKSFQPSQDRRRSLASSNPPSCRPSMDVTSSSSTLVRMSTASGVVPSLKDMLESLQMEGSLAAAATKQVQAPLQAPLQEQQAPHKAQPPLPDHESPATLRNTPSVAEPGTPTKCPAQPQRTLSGGAAASPDQLMLQANLLKPTMSAFATVPGPEAHGCSPNAGSAIAQGSPGLPDAGSWYAASAVASPPNSNSSSLRSGSAAGTSSSAAGGAFNRSSSLKSNSGGLTGSGSSGSSGSSQVARAASDPGAPQQVGSEVLCGQARACNGDVSLGTLAVPFNLKTQMSWPLEGLPSVLTSAGSLPSSSTGSMAKTHPGDVMSALMASAGSLSLQPQLVSSASMPLPGLASRSTAKPATGAGGLTPEVRALLQQLPGWVWPGSSQAPAPGMQTKVAAAFAEWLKTQPWAMSVAMAVATEKVTQQFGGTKSMAMLKDDTHVPAAMLNVEVATATSNLQVSDANTGWL